MIKAIIFDMGSVLIEPLAGKVIEYLSKKFKVEKEEFENYFFEIHMKYEKRIHEDLIDEEVYWNEICNKFNVTKPKSDSLWKEAVKYSYKINKDMLKLIDELKSKYKIALLSNAHVPMKEVVCEKYPMDRFDVVVFSCDVGVSKPSLEIYKIALDRLNIKPEEAIFIDDQETNIIAARQLGIKGLVYDVYANLKEKLFSELN